MKMSYKPIKGFLEYEGTKEKKQTGVVHDVYVRTNMIRIPN